MEEILMLRCQCTIEHRDNYSKRSQSLRKHFKDESSDNIIDSDVEIAVLFKYLQTF